MSRRSVWLHLAMAGACFGALATLSVPCRAQRMKTAYVWLDASSHERFRAAIEFAEKRGAILRHRIYPYAAIGEIPEESRLSISASSGIRRVFLGRIRDKDMLGMSPHELHVAKAYNDIYYPLRGAAEGGSFPGDEPAAREDALPIDPGPLKIPQRYLDEIATAPGVAAAAMPLPPPTSEFMLGHVAVAVVMPESDGVGTHDWLDPEEEDMVEEMISAMDWWAKHAPEENLRFTYEINYRVPVRIEPLDRGGWTIEEKWAGQSLESLGYTGVNHFEQSYEYIDAMRERYGADWGYITFILHGKKGQSFGSFLAYAYLGGPFNANVSSNGRLGPDLLDRVIAHEVGHNFYTLDEYPNERSDCSSRSGYLSVENANQVDGGRTCKLDVACIMRGAGQDVALDDLHPCVYTEGQVGWWDDDGDGIPDVLDTDPVIESLAVETGDPGGILAGDTLYSTSPAFRGVAVTTPLPNVNPESEVYPRDVTIEPVSTEYRVDGGSWTPCEPTDGRFDGPRETFEFDAGDLTPWAWHTVEVRAATAHGNVTPDSLVTSLEFFAVPHLGRTPLVDLASSNPARPPVSITFAPVDPSGRSGVRVPVNLAVYDAAGRRITMLESGEFEAGRYFSTVWDGTDSAGKHVSAGVYFIGMSSQGRTRAEKVLIIR